MPSFGLTSSSAKLGRRGRARRQPHERGDDCVVGLLGRQLAVTVAVEAGVDCPDRLDPGRLERPVFRCDPQTEEDRPVFRQEDQLARGRRLGRGWRWFLRGCGGQGK